MSYVVVCALFASLSAGASEKSNTLNFCADPDWMPFEGVINNQHTGIAHDYLLLFSELTNFTFNLVATESWHESTSFLQSGKCDLTLMLNRSEEREKFLSFTMPYFFGPNVLVTQNNESFLQDLPAIGELTLGVVSGYRLLEEIPRYYPDINIVVLESELDGLLALNSGKIDVYVGSLFSINALMSQHNFNHLKINGWISIQDKLRIGFRKDQQSLIPIFNQAIDSISSRQHNDILNRWSNVRIIKETDYSLVYLTIVVALLLIFTFAWRYSVSNRISLALKAKNEELEKTKKALTSANQNLEYISFHDNLTELYNRHYFMSSLRHHVSNISRQHSMSALLMIDIDFFKQINDEHGHAVGDSILKQFANVLTNVIRSGDIAARWGGEEFIILLPNADKENTMLLANRIRQDVEICDFGNGIHITISIGVSQFNHNEDISSWIERADSALYQAKNSGRNCIKVSA